MNWIAITYMWILSLKKHFVKKPIKQFRNRAFKIDQECEDFDKRFYKNYK